MAGFKFNTEKLNHLNNPERLKDIPPEFIIEKLQLINPEIVVDIGAGTGFFSNEFSKLPSVKKVYALDIADEMINWMKEHRAPENNKIIPKKMQEEKTDLDDNLADVIIMINVHHEFHEPYRILKECKRLIKPGGKVAIVDWAKKETEHGPPVEKRYNPNKIQEQLEQVSFRRVKYFEELPSHYLVVAEN